MNVYNPWRRGSGERFTNIRFGHVLWIQRQNPLQGLVRWAKLRQEAHFPASASVAGAKSNGRLV